MSTVAVKKDHEGVRNRRQGQFGQVMHRLKKNKVAMVGLVFCLFYVTLILYRDIAKPLKIHCLFGLSVKRILVCIAMISVAVTLVAVLIFGILLSRGLTYLRREDLGNVLAGVCALSVLLSVLIHAIGCRTLLLELRFGGRGSV